MLLESKHLLLSSKNSVLQQQLGVEHGKARCEAPEVVHQQRRVQHAEAVQRHKERKQVGAALVDRVLRRALAGAPAGTTTESSWGDELG